MLRRRLRDFPAVLLLFGIYGWGSGSLWGDVWSSTVTGLPDAMHSPAAGGEPGGGGEANSAGEASSQAVLPAPTRTLSVGGHNKNGGHGTLPLGKPATHRLLVPAGIRGMAVVPSAGLLSSLLGRANQYPRPPPSSSDIG